jgi:hypothetical protein
MRSAIEPSRIHMRLWPIMEPDTPKGRRPFGIGIAMSAMTYSEEFLGKGTGQKLSLGPLASDALPKFEHPVTSFTRPGPDVLSETIPVVFIGRNRDGFWVARCADGTFGGLFWRKGSALRFAKANAGPAGCATVFPQARFELDLENHGNPLVACLGTARRLLTRQARRLMAATRKLARY